MVGDSLDSEYDPFLTNPQHAYSTGSQAEFCFAQRQTTQASRCRSRQPVADRTRVKAWLNHCHPHVLQTQTGSSQKSWFYKKPASSHVGYKKHLHSQNTNKLSMINRVRREILHFTGWLDIIFRSELILLFSFYTLGSVLALVVKKKKKGKANWCLYCSEAAVVLCFLHRRWSTTALKRFHLLLFT